ncbi:MAG: hypothetical protein KGQ54_05495 [Verrucomicrobia bacterium]|nr:hypothetical protein [Verrucomicrobiota bacterium]
MFPLFLEENFGKISYRLIGEGCHMYESEAICRIDPVTERLEVLAWEPYFAIADAANRNTAEELKINEEAARRQAEHMRYRSTIEW